MDRFSYPFHVHILAVLLNSHFFWYPINMESISTTLHPSHNLILDAGLSYRKFSTKFRSLQSIKMSSGENETENFMVYNSKESGTSEQDKFSNNKVWTTSSSIDMIKNDELIQHHKYLPLVTAVKTVVKKNEGSFHFPRHNQGRAAPPSLIQLIGERPFLYDIHDQRDLDSLFALEKPILQAQKQAAAVFGASETWFLVEGTTSGIQAAIMGTCNPGDTLILLRNSHISAISAMVLSGVIPKYIFPDYEYDWDITAAVSPSQVEKAIKELELEGQTPAAVFITSPTYHGLCSNINKISELCHSKGIPLIVDEAHGAHFGFHPELPISALQQGADLVVQSTHKVLCSLTQSSMLHLSGKIVDRERICRCLQTLQSTSPSSLLLASLDAATAQLVERQTTIFDDVIHLAKEAKHTIKSIPHISILNFTSFSNFDVIDPLRLTIGVSDLGLSGYEAYDFLYKHQRIIPELVGTRSMTFPFCLGTCSEDVQKLVTGLEHLSSTFIPLQQKHRLGKSPKFLESFNDINMHLTPRDAFFARKRKEDIKNCLGKICGELICPFPPGIPILIPGEVITERALLILQEAKTNGARVRGASDPLLSSLVICDV